jgi:hypothetical protein
LIDLNRQMRDLLTMRSANRQSGLAKLSCMVNLW